MVFAVCYLKPIDEAAIEEDYDENHTFAIPLFSPLSPSSSRKSLEMRAHLRTSVPLPSPPPVTDGLTDGLREF